MIIIIIIIEILILIDQRSRRFSCDHCCITFSRGDRLYSHMRNKHNVPERAPQKKQASRFFCPFKCNDDLPPFRTMTLLLAHCDIKHEHLLGKLATERLYQITKYMYIHWHT